MEPLRKDLILKGAQIYLRPICDADTDRVVKWRNDKNVVKNFIYRIPISREAHLDWLKNKVEQGNVHQFVICRNADEIPLGSVSPPALHFLCQGGGDIESQIIGQGFCAGSRGSDSLSIWQRDPALFLAALFAPGNRIIGSVWHGDSQFSPADDPSLSAGRCIG